MASEMFRSSPGAPMAAMRSVCGACPAWGCELLLPEEQAATSGAAVKAAVAVARYLRKILRSMNLMDPFGWGGVGNKKKMWM